MYNIIKEARVHNSGIHKVVYPPENIFTLPNEERKRRMLKKYARASYSNFYHYGGQCKMAKRVQDGVVNEFLDVFGTINLKVADLSISPILPDGNTSLPAQMIGLNAVRMIKNNLKPYIVHEDDFDDGSD
jgi:choline dehydrogenase